MQIVKYSMLVIVFLASNMVGKLLAQKYKDRLQELAEIKQSLSIFKSKIRFTYEPIPEIFGEIAETTKSNSGKIFAYAKEKMNEKTATIAWEEAVEQVNTNLKQEDKQMLVSLSKLLGMTDVEGQISQIEVTESFLEKQIKEAEEEKRKNEKLYQKLGSIMGLAIVILLF